MEALTLIFTVSIIHILAVISPGPDFIMAIKNSLTYSRKTGIWTAVGFGLGISIHIFYCIAGLALIISQSEIIFTGLKIIGSLYLAYIGIMSLLAKPSEIKINSKNHKKDISILEAIKIGFLTNVLNPKATLFFLSLFTFVISPETSKFILAIISSIMIINTTLWFSLVAIFFTQKKVRVVFYKFEGVFNKIFGVILLLLAIKVSFF